MARACQPRPAPRNSIRSAFRIRITTTHPRVTVESGATVAALKRMPAIVLDQAVLADWGKRWLGEIASDKKEPKPRRGAKKGKKPGPDPLGVAMQVPEQASKVVRVKKAKSFDKKQAMDFGLQFDRAFGRAVAAMLGGIEVREVNGDALLPPAPDIMEVGKTRIVGGIRPQNYDAAYRPDGPRIVYDSKTLNERKSIGKNWQNMINDLSTEATTVHTRFPMCIVAFIVAVPRPALDRPQERDLVRTLERLGTRTGVLDQAHLAEAIALVVWNPADGSINADVPPKESNLRIEAMHTRIETAYLARYANLPPHQETPVEISSGEEGDGSEPQQAV